MTDALESWRTRPLADRGSASARRALKAHA
jgi:hypothetical protein